MSLRKSRYLLELEEGNVVIIFENSCTIETAIEKIKQTTGVKLFNISPLSIDESIELTQSLTTLRIK